jgi:hypothetical protein
VIRRERLERKIEAVMEARLGRPCLFLPSGRLALFLALRAWMKPGGRLLMSPVTDDVIFFAVLAAGLRPVMAPLSPDDGNIALELVPGRVWESVDGVLTTNLYGLPDRVMELRSRCDALGIPLIEDAAHAIETTVGGRRVGTFGEAAAFSLRKHVGAPCGGILAFADEAARRELDVMRDAAVIPGRLRDMLSAGGPRAAEAAVIGLHVVWPVRRVRRTLGLLERSGYRMPLRPVALQRAIAAGAGLDGLHSWLRTDSHEYRARPSAPLLEWTLRRLRQLPTERARRIDGVARLRALPIAAPAVRQDDPQPLFRVPLLIDDREAAIACLERNLVGVGYIYDPPLDDYAGPEFAEPSAVPASARQWAQAVFPVDPLEADELVRRLGRPVSATGHMRMRRTGSGVSGRQLASSSVDAPRVSVVIPVFNAEPYLAEAVESVLGQTMTDLELVAVDDGSQDGSRATLERFARADHRVRVVINERNLGIAGARNRGWRLARAPYIACLDADDVALPDRLLRQADFLDAHPSVGAVGGAAITIDGDGRRISTRRYPTRNRTIQSTLLRHNCMAHPSVTMRRGCLEAIGGYGSLRTSEDYNLWLRLSERFELANLAEPVVLHRLHLNQISLVSLEQQAREARGVCAAARARRASGVDPLAGVRELTPEILDRLRIDEAELAAAVKGELIARAAILADLGHPREAERLVEEASRLLGPRAAEAFVATTELKRAETLLHAHRPVAAAGHVLLALGREPRQAFSLLAGWLGPRVPGGGLLRWT